MREKNVDFKILPVENSGTIYICIYIPIYPFFLFFKITRNQIALYIRQQKVHFSYRNSHLSNYISCVINQRLKLQIT